MNTPGLRERPFYRPAEAYSGFQAFLRQSLNLGPLSHGVGFSVECENNVASRVIVLLLICRPFTICGLVSLIVLLPLNRQPLAVPIGECPVAESYVGLIPLGTYCDPATTIPRVDSAFRISAPLPHGLPDEVQRGSMSSVLDEIASSRHSSRPSVESRVRAGVDGSAERASSQFPIAFDRSRPFLRRIKARTPEA